MAEFDIPAGFSTPSQDSHSPYNSGLNLIRELSPQEHLKEQMAWLEGKIWDDRQQQFITIVGSTPFMNKEGRDMFFQYATAILSPIVTLSNYRADDKKINAIVLMVIKEASTHFHLHWNDYGIKRKTQISVITTKLMILGLSAFYKALGAGDRKAATSNISENINTLSRNFDQNEQPIKKGGMFGGMFRR